MRKKLPKPDAKGLPLDGVPRNRRVLVGVSGGIDSTALLHALVKAGYGKLTVAHLDHGLRGKEGAGDARFVRGLARKWGLAVIVERMDVGALAREEKVSVEMAARRARYGFFARAAKEARCRTIVLAHHADDQAETFLFNLLRGRLRGLSWRFCDRGWCCGGGRSRRMRRGRGSGTVRMLQMRP